MKRFLFVATLLLIVVSQNVFAESYKKIETFKEGDFLYIKTYTDTLKQDIKSFWVWYQPEVYKQTFNGERIEKGITANIFDKINAEAVIEYLAIKHFGEDKVFNSEGESNIFKVAFKIDIHTSKVYFLNILFSSEAYNLITKEEIKNFIEDFNLLKIEIFNTEKYDKDAFILYNFIPFDKNGGYYPIKEDE